jgi:ribosomal protein L37E|tara:strand:+ start:100 stop:561 length:462 start_codon:yes stop_codon:yes gene_type:complete
MNTDKLTVCARCGSDACYIQEVTADINLKQCMGCGFQSNSLMIEGNEFYDLQMESLPELYKDLMWMDKKTRETWMPSTINIPTLGMVFANGPSKDNWRWSAVKAVPVKEEEKTKYPIPGKKDQYYEFRMDMSTRMDYIEKDYLEALDFIGIFN